MDAGAGGLRVRGSQSGGIAGASGRFSAGVCGLWAR
jgi:hypothetical protein